MELTHVDRCGLFFTISSGAGDRVTEGVAAIASNCERAGREEGEGFCCLELEIKAGKV